MSKQADVDRLRELKEDWDSYGAPPIDPEHIDAAKKVVRALEAANISIYCVGPTPDGTVVIRVLLEGEDIGLEVNLP